MVKLDEEFSARDADEIRSFELSVENSRGGVMLLHGLSDSPYSMRARNALAHELGDLADD